MVRIGIIGIGGIAQKAHITQLKEIKKAVITAVCDINKEHLKKVGDELNIPEEKRYTNYRELIADEQVDAVEICTPNYLHVPMAVEVIKAGKHVNVEKPMAHCYDAVLPLIDVLADKSKNQVAMTCFTYRFRPAVRYAKALIEQGCIGDIINVSVEYLKSSAFTPGRMLEWRFIKEEAGSGVLGDLGVHLIDMTRILAGEFRSVICHTEIIVKERMKMDGSGMGKVETDDFCSFIARLENNATANFTISRCAYGKANSIRYDIYGTKGVMSLDLNHPEILGLCIGDKERPEKSEMKMVTVPEQYFATQEETFVRAVLGQMDEFFPDISEAIVCQKILSALQESSEKKCWINLE